MSDQLDEYAIRDCKSIFGGVLALERIAALEQQLADAKAALEKESDNAIADKKLTFKLAEERDSLRAAVAELRALNITNSKVTLGEVVDLREQLVSQQGAAARADAYYFEYRTAMEEQLRAAEVLSCSRLQIIEKQERACDAHQAALTEANRQRDAANDREILAYKVVDGLKIRFADLEAAQSHGTFADYLQRQREWSLRTFGTGKRTGGVTQHIAKELDEIRSDPSDFKEWIDVIILAMDGYWRCGGADIEGDLDRKQKINFARQWPAPTSEDTAIEHVRPANSGTFAEGLEAAAQRFEKEDAKFVYSISYIVRAIRSIPAPAAKERE